MRKYCSFCDKEQQFTERARLPGGSIYTCDKCKIDYPLIIRKMTAREITVLNSMPEGKWVTALELNATLNTLRSLLGKGYVEVNSSHPVRDATANLYWRRL